MTPTSLMGCRSLTLPAGGGEGWEMHCWDGTHVVMATLSAAMATSTSVIVAVTVDVLACSVVMVTFSLDLIQSTPVRRLTTAWLSVL